MAQTKSGGRGSGRQYVQNRRETALDHSLARVDGTNGSLKMHGEGYGPNAFTSNTRTCTPDVGSMGNRDDWTMRGGKTGNSPHPADHTGKATEVFRTTLRYNKSADIGGVSRTTVGPLSCCDSYFLPAWTIIWKRRNVITPTCSCRLHENFHLRHLF
jgi:hypothetical protein